jgi:hypothetical protein
MWKFGNKRGIQEIKWKSTFMQEKFLYCFACCSFAVLLAVCVAVELKSKEEFKEEIKVDSTNQSGIKWKSKIFK